MKAILVIDMPKQCYGCDFCQFDGTSYGRVCTRTGVYVQKDGFNITKSRHETCPLKPLPQRKEELYYPCNEYVQTFNEGYNRCIDDMLGDTEDE